MRSLFLLIFLAACNQPVPVEVKPPSPVVEVAKEAIKVEPVALDHGNLCKKTKTDHCAEVDMDSPDAQSSYTLGCEAQNFYSCYRLGQFFQTKKNNEKEAIRYYEIACGGKDEYGCESSYDLHMKLCYDNLDPNYCGKKDPKGVYRVIAYLENYDPKYEDAFFEWDFDGAFFNARAEKMFQAAVKERNPKLLENLLLAQKKGKHDGANAEGLTETIRILKGSKPSL